MSGVQPGIGKPIYPVLFVLCALAGVGLGIGGLRLYTRLTTRPEVMGRIPPFEPAKQDPVKEAPPEPKPSPAAATQPAGQSPATQGAPAQTAKPDPNAARPGPQAAKAPVPPNPFSGPMGINPLRPKDWSGMLPDIKGPEVAPKPAPPEQYRLVEVTMDASALAKVSLLAQQFGGTSKAILEFQGDRRQGTEGALVSSPPAKTQALLAALGKAGATISLDWKGEAPDRQRMLTEKSASTLHDLQRKRQELMARYYEDSIPVRDVDEQIKAITDALKKYNDKSLAKADAIKILFTTG